MSVEKREKGSCEITLFGLPGENPSRFRQAATATMGGSRLLHRPKFVDRLRIVATGGRGGDGCSSFFRDSRVARGAADGGSGGDGGVVRIRASEHLGDLNMPLKSFRAGSGANGSSALMGGRRGEDVLIRVPCGTIINRLGLPTRGSVPMPHDMRTPKLVAELLTDGDEILVANGGTGGRGNASLRSGKLQSSRMAEDGIPGEQERAGFYTATLLHY